MITKVLYRFELNHVTFGPTTIPIANFSARLREGDQDSYLQATIPNFTLYSSTITDYVTDCRDSYMTLYKRLYSSTSPSSYTEYTLLTVDVESVDIEEGSISNSIVLTGHRATWNTAPTTRTVVVPNYIKRGLTTDLSYTYRVRCGVSNIIYPSDTVVVTSGSSSYSFIATLVSLTSTSVEASSDG